MGTGSQKKLPKMRDTNIQCSFGGGHAPGVTTKPCDAYYSNSRYSMDLEGGTYQAHGHGVGGACAGMACSLRRGQQVPGHYKACLLPCLTQLGFYYIFSSLPVSLLSHV